MKNGIIINGKAYVLKSIIHELFFSENVCNTRCALKKKCEKMQGNPCELFAKNGHVPFFERVKLED